LDELLNQATNRAKATVLSALLIEQMIIDLNKDFNVNVVFISGNEGRKQQESGASEIILSNNYDWMIMEMVKFMFRGAEGVTFHDGPMGERVINVNGWNVLMIHGNQIKSDNNMTTIQKIKGKYADKGISIQYVIFGHLHAAQICDIYARSSSLCGANAYSESELQFSSRASQNLHIMQAEDLDVIKIDLQNVDGIEGYKIDEDLEAYNAKSASKVSSMQIPTI
jgi:predicted phosphodiesterase